MFCFFVYDEFFFVVCYAGGFFWGYISWVIWFEKIMERCNFDNWVIVLWYISDNELYGVVVELMLLDMYYMRVWFSKVRSLL